VAAAIVLGARLVDETTVGAAAPIVRRPHFLAAALADPFLAVRAWQ
jgi:hypothetical protein